MVILNSGDIYICGMLMLVCDARLEVFDAKLKAKAFCDPCVVFGGTSLALSCFMITAGMGSVTSRCARAVASSTGIMAGQSGVVGRGSSVVVR